MKKKKKEEQQDFLAVIKLVSGEEIISTVTPCEEDDRTREDHVVEVVAPCGCNPSDQEGPEPKDDDREVNWILDGFQDSMSFDQHEHEEQEQGREHHRQGDTQELADDEDGPANWFGNDRQGCLVTDLPPQHAGRDEAGQEGG